MLLAEIVMAFLSVYGAYCLIINLVFTLLYRKNDRIRLTFLRSDEDAFEPVYTFFVKKVFLGRIKTAILINCKNNEVDITEVAEKNPCSEIYRAERIDKFER